MGLYGFAGHRAPIEGRPGRKYGLECCSGSDRGGRRMVLSVPGTVRVGGHFHVGQLRD